MYNRYPRTLEIKFLNRNNIIFELKDRLLMVSLNLRKPTRMTWEVKVYLTLCTQWGHVREWWYSSICSYPRHRPLYPLRKSPVVCCTRDCMGPYGGFGLRTVSCPSRHFSAYKLVSRYPGFSTLSDAKGEKARRRAVGWDTALQAGRSRVRFPMVSLKFSLA